MPQLRNPRQELFAQNLTLGMSQTEAYRKAGYANDRRHASRLATNGDVRRRRTELFEEKLEGLRIDRETMTNCYITIMHEAREANNFAVAKGAADSLAKLHGLMNEQKEVGKKDQFACMTDAELIDFITATLPKL
jgi:phage terminase small subunit